MRKRNAIIMGAAGRDFHNFNVFFRRNPLYNVVAFTAEQIPGIDSRRYPPQLSGPAYPRGIPIYPEPELPALIRKNRVSEVFLSYSDLSNEAVMQKAAVAIACGATFSLLGPEDTYIKSGKPVIAICAVRTGCGKSPLSRFVVNFLRKKGYRVAVVRHPMPYGDLSKQAVQRFASLEDLDSQDCTIEEREEYEPHIRNGAVVYAGVDYGKILRAAEKEADVILWDGGNNDLPFYRPDLHVTVADPHRPGHELLYYPGESNFLMADAIVISKVNTARPANVRLLEKHARQCNPGASMVKSRLDITADGSTMKGRSAIVVEDGPTLTHGGMKYGAGMIAAKKYGAKPIDPRKYAAGSIRDVYRKYGHIGRILPAMGYSRGQVKELEQTINRARCDIVIDGTPADIGRLMKINKPVAGVDYEFGDINNRMADILGDFEKKLLKKAKGRKKRAL